MKKSGILILLVLLMMMVTLCNESVVRLKELSGAGGRFCILEDHIYAFDTKDFTIKVFSKEGKLKFSKVIKGQGPGEVSTQSFITLLEDKNLLVIEPMRKKWVKYDKKLNFLKEGKFTESITFVKKTGKGLIGGLAGFDSKYYRKLILYDENFEKVKEIYKEYGESFKGKILSNELHITFDSSHEIIAVAHGNSKRVKFIDYNGNLKKEMDLNIKPTPYKEEELLSLFKSLPEEAKEWIEFKEYPLVFQVLFISNDKLLIITGEVIEKKAKSYLYDRIKGSILKNFSLPLGFYQQRGNMIYILDENDRGCILREIFLSY